MNSIKATVKLKLGLLVAAVFLSASANADILSTKLGDANKPEISVPLTGQSMEKVENQYGPPLEKMTPVGEPPITRWRYAEYTVYFEHEHVIHSVIHPRK